MILDVVCKMKVDAEDAITRGLVSDFEGQTYYFCSPDCKQKFDLQPQDYADRQNVPVDDWPLGPFHPFAG